MRVPGFGDAASLFAASAALLPTNLLLGCLSGADWADSAGCEAGSPSCAASISAAMPMSVWARSSSMFRERK
ncbi:hypothetical protein IMZ48_31110 [Candidatus Bathyarchaeota archaeon]|nr:hypothetical protein [Candidatus Bathyarchaeota archaeon]